MFVACVWTGGCAERCRRTDGHIVSAASRGLRPSRAKWMSACRATGCIHPCRTSIATASRTRSERDRVCGEWWARTRSKSSCTAGSRSSLTRHTAQRARVGPTRLSDTPAPRRLLGVAVVRAGAVLHAVVVARAGMHPARLSTARRAPDAILQSLTRCVRSASPLLPCCRHRHHPATTDIARTLNPNPVAFPASSQRDDVGSARLSRQGGGGAAGDAAQPGYGVLGPPLRHTSTHHPHRARQRSTCPASREA
jgi:hypothetical protein